MTHEFEGIGQCSMLVNARIMGKKGNPSSTIIVGIQDITALKQAQEELEHFSYTITHDMRAPLRAMRGYGEILLRQKESLSPEHRDYLERIAASAERMDQLILDALNYSKLVRQEIEVTPVDCDSLLMGMLDSYPHFKETKGTITVDGTMPVVMGNAAALTQCFSNLLNNALKFTKPGQPPEVRIWAEDKGERVRIWVEDKGIGIAKEAQERIFIMFQKLSPEGEGTGIGLALVRKAAERMNGRVGVESELGKGSRFWLEFNKA